jgi:hypothetical protein
MPFWWSFCTGRSAWVYSITFKRYQTTWSGCFCCEKLDFRSKLTDSVRFTHRAGGFADCFEFSGDFLGLPTERCQTSMAGQSEWFWSTRISPPV